MVEAPALRQFQAADLEGGHALTRGVSWPHRLEDWHFFHSLGFGFAAEEGGQLLGTALGWEFGEDHGAVGLIVVAPEAQGRGLGRLLTSAVLERLGDRSVALTATDAGYPLYVKLGFEVVGAVHQHQGAAFSVGLVPLAAGERLRPLGRSDLELVRGLDAAATGLDRAALLEALLGVAEGVVLERGGQPVGFSLLRRFGRGHVIGPVVAPDLAAAQALVAHWLGVRSGQFLRIDVPAESGLSPWLQEMGLAQVDNARAMRRGPAPVPRGDVARFALVSQALG
nr:GNAT family N-acetyltransferase [Roseomonas sp. GC11]